jgi:hypothetical protein
MTRLSATVALVLLGLGVVVTHAAAQVGAPAGAPPAVEFPAPDCACPAPCGKTCVQVPDVHRVHHPIYDCRREDYCAQPCFLRGLFQHGCPQCGPVRTKTHLLKQVVTTECPTTRCVVQDGCGVPALEPTPVPVTRIVLPR